MSIIFSNSQFSSVNRSLNGPYVTSITAGIPASNSTQLIVALVVCNSSTITGNTFFNTPSGWTEIETVYLTTSGNYYGGSAAYWKVGDGSTSQGFTVSANMDNINVTALIFDGTEMTTPIVSSATSTSSDGTTNHSITGSAGATDMLVAFFTVYIAGSGQSWASGSIAGMETLGADAPEGNPSIGQFIAYGVGASGSKSVSTTHGAAGAHLIFALAPYPGPSIPVLTFPNGGESLTAGAVVNTTWTQSTSPTAAQSTLKYNLEYSINNGSTWVNMVTLTGTGVGTYAWTVPATLTSGGLVRIRSNDPAAALFSLAYDQSDSAFSIVTESTPGQPGITAPSVGSIHNKASNVTVGWTHQGGVGNPQVAFTLQWSRDNFASHTATVGPTTTGTQSTSIDFSGETAGTTISARVKTQGVSLYSAYSNISSFVVVALPATPNITAPINASPPTTPLVTATFTSADAFVSQRWRVTVGGVQVFSTDYVSNTSLSYPLSYAFANAVEAVLYLSVKNSYGLASAEDSETLTPAYAGPATPTLTLDASTGYILAQITNSDTPDYNELWAYEATAAASTAIKISPALPVDASFAWYGATSGVGYRIFARAYNAVLYTDSTTEGEDYFFLDENEDVWVDENEDAFTDTDIAITLTLINGFLHSVSRTNINSNVDGSAISLVNTAGQWTREESAQPVKLVGGTAPGVILGQSQWQRMSVSAVLAPYSQVAPLLEIWRTQKVGGVICFRDQKGNRIFGKMTEPRIRDESTYLVATFEVIESNYAEGL